MTFVHNQLIVSVVLDIFYNWIYYLGYHPHVHFKLYKSIWLDCQGNGKGNSSHLFWFNWWSIRLYWVYFMGFFIQNKQNMCYTSKLFQSEINEQKEKKVVIMHSIWEIKLNIYVRCMNFFRHSTNLSVSWNTMYISYCLGTDTNAISSTS